MIDPRDDALDNQPPSPLGMLDILSAEKLQAAAREKAAKDMMAGYALQAILDGASPVDVAARCGFIRMPKKSGARNGSVVTVDSMFYPPAPPKFAQHPLHGIVELYEHDEADGMPAFIKWIQAYVREVILNGPPSAGTE